MKDFCNVCGTYKCRYNRSVQLASDESLGTEEYYELIWQIMFQLAGKNKPSTGKIVPNRRELVKKLTDLFCQFCCANFQLSSGEAFYLPEYEDILPDDGDCTWFGRYLEKDASGLKPLRYYNAARYQGKYQNLLRMLDIAAKLIDPNAFKRFE